MPGASSYLLGIVTALEIERIAVYAAFDEKYGDPPQTSSDIHGYHHGRIGNHNVVLTALIPDETGKASAARTAIHLMRTYSNLKHIIMVGIGGGAPSAEHDIRLGDVVVSTKRTVQFDLGRYLQNGELMVTGEIERPSQRFRSVIGKIRSEDAVDDSFTTTFEATINQIQKRITKPKTYNFSRPSTPDILYPSDYAHSDAALALRCTEAKCDQSKAKKREERKSTTPQVFDGKIATSDVVMKNSIKRDEIRDKHDILCFEMEAAGIAVAAGSGPDYLIIRGICDYADSHKDKSWQGFASLTAAAYLKLLLSKMPPFEDVDARKL